MIATKKPSVSYQCKCGAKYVKHYGRCFECKEFGTLKEVTVAPKVKDKSALDVWFEFQRDYEKDNGDCKCDNCGKPIRHQLLSKDTWIWRGAICHIVPKSKYKSVATHLHNFLIMDLDCHSQFDSSYENAQKMPVFALAKKKFKLFKNCITEPITKIEKYFL